MSEQLLELLKLGLLALLYLFFLRVIWAVWTELRSPAVEPGRPARARSRNVSAATTAAAGSGRGPLRRPSLRALEVVEPPALRGIEYPLQGEMTLGRAPGCTVVIDDTYVSQLHARVFSEGDDYRVEDLGSTNGTLHNGDAVSSPRPIEVGDRIQVGNVVLEAVR